MSNELKLAGVVLLYTIFITAWIWWRRHALVMETLVQLGSEDTITTQELS